MQRKLLETSFKISQTNFTDNTGVCFHVTFLTSTYYFTFVIEIVTSLGISTTFPDNSVHQLVILLSNSGGGL